MKRYFYVQATEEELMDKDRFDLLADYFSDADIYIDGLDNTKWEVLKKKMDRNDELYTNSIASLSLDTNDFINKIRYIETCGIRLFDANKQILHIIEIIETVEFLSTRARYMSRRKQLMGIERSLAKKKMGEGRYGRPRVQVPADFDEKVRYMTEHRMSLESYRQSLDIKRSTFYRLVREVKDSWKNKY